VSQIDSIKEQLLVWEQTSIPMVFYIRDTLLCSCLSLLRFPFLFVPMKDIRMEPWVCETLQLPSIRNEEKDTIHHLWNMLHKIPCLAEGFRFNPFQTDFFAYIDFHSPTFF